MNKKELCKNIQNNVSKLTNIEIIELFKIILATGENYTKNNNGVFINLNWLNDETIHKINNYISFCIKSQNEITKYELMKSLLNETIVSKEEIDINEKQYLFELVQKLDVNNNKLIIGTYGCGFVNNWCKKTPANPS